MFSFIHAADLHLDSPLRGLSRYEGAPVEKIRGATRRALENLVDLALEREIDFVLIAGDLYDGDQKDYDTALFFNRQMQRLLARQIPVFTIRGNHDAGSVITRTLTSPENVQAYPLKRAATVLHPNLPVAIHGQGFANASVQENLAAGYPAAAPDRFNIGLLHTSLAGSSEHDTYAPCSLADLHQKAYQYWALGHIHQPSVIQESPWIVYSGNPQGRKINELGPRGCYLVEVNDSLEVSSHTFEPLDVVRWAHLEIDLSEVTSTDVLREMISARFATALQEAGDRLLAVRLTLSGATELHGLLHSQLGQCQAECMSLAGEIDPDQLWMERLKLRTTPTYDPAELATRDDLTALVLKSLEDFDPLEKPAAVSALESKLPPAALEALEAERKSESLRDKVSAIVLHSIATSHTE